MKRSLSQFALLALVGFCLLAISSHTASAVLPSGNGQTTKAFSVSVAPASDATWPVSGTVSVDTSALATAAKQDTAQTSLSTLAASAAGSKTAGQATMANSVPVVVASNQSSLPTTEASAAAILAALVLMQQPTRTAAVTISDATDLTSTCTKGLYVGVGGNIAVKLAGDSSAVTKKNVPSGTYLVGAYARVMSTNTTGCTVAGDCICYYGP